MLVQLFDVSDKKVVPNHNTYLVPELKAIIDNFPKEYLKVLAYIFFTTCPDGTNAYINLPENQREGIIIKDLQPFTFWLEDMSIELAQKKCRELYSTPTLRLLQGQQKMVDKVADYLDKTEITEGKDSNAMAIDRFMAKGLEYAKILNELGNIVKEEQSKVRGDIRVPHYQRADYQEKENNLEDWNK